MKYLASIDLAFKNLISSKLRSILAILGILVGTSSVVALISSSQLATMHALAAFKSLGTNLIAVSIQQAFSAEGMAGGSQNQQQQQIKFTLADLPQIKQAAPQIESVAPYTNSYQNFTMADLNTFGQVLGATEELDRIAKIAPSTGRLISYLDSMSFFCNVGVKVAQKIRDAGKKVIGNQIKIGSEVFTIIGVLKPWTQPSPLFYADIDSGAIIPIKTSYLLGSQVKISNLLVRVKPTADLDTVQNQMRVVLTKLLPGQQFDFHNPQQIINTISAQRKTFTWMLASIGGISLLVGGIGVMNIMLVSVVERRREIGIRMAVGARPRDILRMFLIEGVLLTLLGGFVGVILGVSISFALAYLSGWEFTLFLLPPALGFAVSVIVGLISGFYPAYRASQLDPIKTLQSD